MRIIIIGAVAAGTSAAAKARRNDETAEIVIYDKDSFISYSGCGMPYYIGDEVEEADLLTPRNPSFFKKKYNVDVRIMHEVCGIDPKRKSIIVKNLLTQEIAEDVYDKLIIATGASSVVPPIEGAINDFTFSLRTISDMNHIKEYLNQSKPQKAVVIGTGFVGLEVCESLMNLGIQVTLVERLSHLTPALDEDMAIHLEDHLKSKGIVVYKGVEVCKIEPGKVILKDHREIEADFVLLSVGVKPNTQLAKEAGIELGSLGGILVNERMMTNIEDIYACGDCIELLHAVTNKSVYRPMGSTANKTGRIAGDVITGGNLSFRGILGTGIVRVLGKTVATTGLSEREATSEGYEVVVCHNIKPNRPEYMGGKEMVIKGIADRQSGRLLGAQIIGEDGVDKRIDVFATAITFHAKVEDLFHLDLAYAPPFSTTKDPVMYTGMILHNAIHEGRNLMTANELIAKIDAGQSVQIIDARVSAQYEKGHVDTATNFPHATFREQINQLDKNRITVTYCNKGVTGNAAQNILLNHGFKNVYNLSGGYKNYSKIVKSRDDKNEY